VQPARRQRGFSYLLVLFFLAAISAGLAAVGELWATSRQQERELELLYAGSAFRRAIGAYFQAGPGAVKQYPATLEQLLKDPRFPDTRRYLRQLYADPMSGKTEWELIKAPQGGIMGIASPSERAPLKRAGFDGANRVFEDQAVRLKEKLRYRDWEFVYDPAMRVTTSDQGSGLRAP
jgi:type II secretory pathway pseudopilin PulG